MRGSSSRGPGLWLLVMFAAIVMLAWAVIDRSVDRSPRAHSNAGNTGGPRATGPPPLEAEFRPEAPAASRSVPPVETPEAFEIAPDESATHDRIDGPLLRVLRADGTPAAGATVEFLSLSKLEPAERERYEGYGEALFREHGSTFRAAADGTVRLPQSDDTGTWIHASLDGEWARFETRTPHPDGITLPLHVEQTLTIQTVDTRGVPIAGIPVALFLGVPDPHGSSVRLGPWRGVTTGPEASCIVPHLGWFLNDRTKAYGLGDPYFFASVNLAMLDAPRVELDPIRPLEGPAVLETPAFGSVVVHLTDHDGNPAPDGAYGLLRIIDEAPASQWDRDPVLPFTHDFSVDGAVRFGGLEVGRHFGFRAHLGNRSTRTLEVTGPTVQGEVVEISAQLGEPPLLYAVTLRIVAPSGEPLRDRSVCVRTVAIGQRPPRYVRSTRATHTTDASGRIRVEIGRNSGPREFHVVVARPGEASSFAHEWAGRTSVDVDGGEAEIDGGDTIVERLPLLLAGRVVDGQGKPIEGATVGTYLQRDYGRERVQVLSDGDGRFSMYDRIPDDDLSVWASKHGYESDGTVTVVPGAADHEVVLERATRLEGRVTLINGLEEKSIRVTLVTAAGEDPVRIRRSSTFATNTIPGPATLRISLRGHDRPLQELDVELVEGETLDVGEIRIGTDLQFCEVRVETPAGKPRRSMRVYSAVAGEPSGLLGLTDRFGRLRFATARFPVELVVRGRGTRSVRATGTQEPSTIVVSDGIPIGFEFEGDATAIDWSNLHIEISPIGETARMQPNESNYTDMNGFRKGPNGSTQYVLPLPGTYEVTFRVYRFGRIVVDGEIRSSVWESIRAPMRITVAETEVEQRFPYDFDLDALRVARERLAGYQEPE